MVGLYLPLSFTNRITIIDDFPQIEQVLVAIGCNFII
jgi:hypothetical protein